MNPIQSLTRPKVAQLGLSVYNRNIHPELQESLVHARYAFGDYEAIVHITREGHWIELTRQGGSVAEVVGQRQFNCSRRHRLGSYRLNDCRTVEWETLCNVKYQSSFHCEHLERDLFIELHRESLIDAQQANLSYLFQPARKKELPSLSFARIEPTVDSLSVHFFHTSVNDSAIIRTQSLFEWE